MLLARGEYESERTWANRRRGHSVVSKAEEEGGRERETQKAQEIKNEI